MRTISFAQGVIYGMAHLLGIDPELDLLKDQARAWVASVNSKVRYAWTFWPWPELEITEERAFRQVWHTDVTYRAGQGEESEVYYIPNETYYRAIGTPPAGTLPTNATYFEEIAAAEFDRHIAYEQTGKQSIEMVVDIGRSNPRPVTSARKWGYSPSGYGIDVPFTAGPTVWVTYIPRPPTFSTATYSKNKAYVRGDVILDITSGDCYIALQASQDKGVSLTAYWLRQDFPYFLSEYVKYAAAADQTDDMQTKADLRAQGEEALRAEVSKLLRQGQRTTYRRPGAVARQTCNWPEAALVT
jgi:hypothetical protein